MGYKYFRLACMLRVTLLALTLALCSYLIFHTSLYATMTIVGIAIILQVAGLIHYVEKTNRLLAGFLSSIKYSDFSQSYPSPHKDSAFDDLNQAMSEVVGEFRKTRSEREEQLRYFRTVVQHIGLGLLAYDQNGNVDLINTATKKLLGINHLKNITTLGDISEKLLQTLQTIQSGEKKLIPMEINLEPLRLSIYATGFKLRDRNITLVSLQNIASELAEQEMEAWQKLIRVLTHEIMNSVTPIASLASTANGLMNEWKREPHDNKLQVEHDSAEDVRQAVAIIERRSMGLLHFVDSYRNLTRIPAPKFELFPISSLFSRVILLMDAQIQKSQIKLTTKIDPDSPELHVDRELIEQVLINLVLNAIQALDGTADGRIELAAFPDEHGRVIISVSDNGPGIEPAVLEKIFTPFFTTKKDGSGIGLSLSRQIMRLHKGGLSAHSIPGSRTTFSLRF